LRLAKIRPPEIKFPPLRPRFKLGIGLFLLSVLGFYLLVLRGLPSPRQLITRDLEISTKIYDRKGRLLYKIFKDKNRTLISLAEIPLHVRQTT
jgi:membrane carboxypeptidase/penicillin-binding protein